MDCTCIPRGSTKGAKEVEIHELNKPLCEIATSRDGDLDALYEALERNPEVLDEIDKIPFVQTSLHVAASHTPRDEARRTHFALELLSLKPSLGKKLNPHGQSPLHLALSKGFSALAKRLINYDSELIRVKGREQKTPLHCLAEIGDAETNLLAEFLCACPESINDLTIRDETALHIAVKHRQVKAFKLIFEWIWRSYHGEVLNRKDEDGNTVLHIAASTNQLDIVRYLVRRAPIINIERNSIGQTAFDIAQDEEIKKILSGRVKVPPIREDGHGLKKNTNSLDEFLLTQEPRVERFLRFILYCRRELSLDMRNMVLVVAVLIATATYQDLGNLTDDKSSTENRLSSIKNNTGIGYYGDITNYVLNTISFTASVAVMALIFSFRPFTGFLHMSLVFLTISYGYKMAHLSQEQAVVILLIVPSLLAVVYGFKLYFKGAEREIKMEMPWTWLEPSPRWKALPPVPVPLERLRMVYKLMRG
ncbi:hypothetical protein Vadar_033567 [Vaccinium darrowii]|uniref:Uncharacterized protein n=1 Tax=Vaccinium darrowii TaxID=229202 RepID=A0ACB7Z0F5_9ERIC|nr:hypothetical protein Vadar_033567 [Vaccinium darrowii]